MLNGIVPALAHPTDVGNYDSDVVPDLMVKVKTGYQVVILRYGCS